MNSSPGIPQTRSTPIDIARGIAIIGVVFNHTVDGLIGAGLLAETTAVGQVNAALYIFRMPALFFLVGLFIPSGVTRRGAVEYLRSRTALLIWLYLLWQVIQGSVQAATNGVRNGETSLVDILTVWYPLAQLWFLPTLALGTAIVVLSRCWEATRSGRAILATLVVFGVLAWGWDLEFIGLRGLALVAFLALGAAIGLPRMTRLLGRHPVVWAAVAAIALVGTLSLSPFGTEPATVFGSASLAGRMLSLLAAALGVVAVLAISVVASRIPVLSPALVAVGGRTLGIYLMHIVVVAGGRVILTALGVDSVGVMLALLLPAGVVVPMVVESLARRIHLGWLFALPEPFARALTAPGTPMARHRSVIRPLHGVGTLRIPRLGFDRRSRRRTGVSE